MAVDKALVVKVDEDVEGRVEDVAHFFRGESTLGQNLAEVFFGILHDGIDERQVFQTEAAGVKNGQQVRMSEMSSALPEGKLFFGNGRAGGYQFEDRFLAGGIREFNQIDGAEFHAGEALAQDEFSFDGLAFPFFPLFTHNAPHANLFGCRQSQAGSLLPLPAWEKHQSVWVWATSGKTEGSRRRGLGACRPHLRTGMCGSNRVPVAG